MCIDRFSIYHGYWRGNMQHYFGRYLNHSGEAAITGIKQKPSHGKCEFFNPDGSRAEGYCFEGQEEGLWVYFNSNGVVIKQELFRAGLLLWSKP